MTYLGSKIKAEIITSSYAHEGAINMQPPIKNKVYFIKDSVKIGDSIPLISILKYPKSIELIQPDSSYNYLTFEYIDKKTFPSIQIDNIILDSTVYYLRTFEIDSTQNIKLEATIINKNDSLNIISNTDSITLISQVTDISSSLINNTLFSVLKSIFNSEKVIYLIIIILSIIILLFILFRKKIIKYFKIRKIKIQLNKFNIEFELLSKNYSKNNKIRELEKLLLLWKRFMEKFTNKPFSSSTTNEISYFINDKNILGILSTSDKCIYSDNNSSIELENLNALKLKAKNVADKYIVNIRNE